MADEYDGYDEVALKEMVSCGCSWRGEGRVALPHFLSSRHVFQTSYVAECQLAQHSELCT